MSVFRLSKVLNSTLSQSHLLSRIYLSKGIQTSAMTSSLLRHDAYVNGKWIQANDGAKFEGNLGTTFIVVFSGLFSYIIL